MFHRHLITLVILILPLLRSAQGAAQTASAAEQTVPAASSSASRVGTALQVSQNGRHLVDREGRPFLWLGDTAWLLFQMTTREDAELYLKTRASQGFTVIQAAVVMGEERVGGTLRPNVYGDLAFADGNPASPLITSGKDVQRADEYDYWDHVDYGNTNTWNFGSYKAEGTQDWKQALRSPGAAYLSVLTKLLASVEWWNLVPDPSVFIEGIGSGETRRAAMRSTAGDRLLVYLSHPGTVPLRLDGITATSVAQATWVDPQTGTRTAIGQFPTAGKSSFSSPKGWSDAILLVEAKRDSGRTVSGRR